MRDAEETGPAPMMSLTRFRDCADAYGAVIARWPTSDRDAAMQLAAQPEARAILAQAMWLDDTLDSWQVAAPGLALRDRVLAGAPKPRHRLATRARLWWSGIGIAATLTGALAGAAAVALMVPAEPAADAATSFGDVTFNDVSAQES